MKAKLAYMSLAALIAVGIVSTAGLAQTPPTQPTASPATPTAPPAAPAATPTAAAAPAAASAPAIPAAVEPAPAKVAVIPKPHLSHCALAIRASERKLEKSSAPPEKVAEAWHHIEEAKKTRGEACQAHAREAADLL